MFICNKFLSASSKLNRFINILNINYTDEQTEIFTSGSILQCLVHPRLGRSSLGIAFVLAAGTKIIGVRLPKAVIIGRKYRQLL